MTDLIPRMAAIQACQVGPSDEWSKATKSGYEQAATDCQRNILRIKPAAIDPAQARVKPLDVSYVQKHAFLAGVVAARNIPATHPCSGPLLWLDYDPGDNPALTRILAALEPQPDPRDEVIARLVEALHANVVCAEKIADAVEIDPDETFLRVKVMPGGREVATRSWSEVLSQARAALAAAKAVQK